ncbi:uncharacterized protein LOC124162422 [Ischnura elegans]|uniref:uncharacterized protein LOC124162422 n=1 Tax=Ischnura elegans TaxID=197161 RepID=UPI001ED878DA|nr:uncharacterized protein LOC124162422 [Ischnura elegans]
MPGSTAKRKKNRSGKCDSNASITFEQPKLVTDLQKLELSAVTEEAEKPWFHPSVKGIDRSMPRPSPAASKRVPIVTLRGVDDTMKLISLLREIIDKEGFTIGYRPDRLAVHIRKISDFVLAVNFFDKLGLQYHYKNTIEDNRKRYVLRGIPSGNEPDISNAFKERGFIVHDVHRLVGPKSSLSAPVFVFYHTPLPGGPEITGVKRLGKWMVNIESYKGTRREPMLCVRCSRYNHTATFCTMDPRCFKCAADHEGSLCRVTAVFKCCNCNGNHPAVAKTCPMYLRVKEFNMRAREGVTGSHSDLFRAVLGKASITSKPKKPPSRLPKLIARSFVVVAWNARGVDLGDCPQFFEFLETQGAHLACISEWKKVPVAAAVGNGRWSVIGSAAGGLLVRTDVAHKQLQMRTTVVMVQVQTKMGVGLRVAMARVGPNDSFSPDELLGALTQCPGDQALDPTIIFGDFSARHQVWNAPVNNRRGKALNRTAEASQLRVFGPKNPSRYYGEDESPYVVVTKNVPVVPSILPKRMATGGGGEEGRCPMVVHLRNWRLPKASRRVELPAEVKELIREKNRMRKMWQTTKFSLFKEELDRKRAEVRKKVEAVRRSAK